MGRILLWLLIGFGAYLAWRWWSVKRRLRSSRPGAAARPAAGETMVRCEVCGLNVPQSEAIGAGGRWFCSDEHRRRVSG